MPLVSVWTDWGQRDVPLRGGVAFRIGFPLTAAAAVAAIKVSAALGVVSAPCYSLDLSVCLVYNLFSLLS